MQNQDGTMVSSDDLLKDGLAHLAEASVFFYELETEAGKALACFTSSLLAYGNAILRNQDPRSIGIEGDEINFKKRCEF